jgi:hypothetical protein
MICMYIHTHISIVSDVSMHVHKKPNEYKYIRIHTHIQTYCTVADVSGMYACMLYMWL